MLEDGTLLTEPFGARVRVLTWGDEPVQLVDTVLCPLDGAFELELLSEPPSWRAAIDIRPVDGHVLLRDDTRVVALRTWHEAGLERRMSYRYHAPGLRMHVSTGYEEETRAGHVVFTTRSGWAGFRVERPSRYERLYRGTLSRPGTDFTELVFRLLVRGA